MWLLVSLTLIHISLLDFWFLSNVVICIIYTYLHVSLLEFWFHVRKLRLFKCYQVDKDVIFFKKKNAITMNAWFKATSKEGYVCINIFNEQNDNAVCSYMIIIWQFDQYIVAHYICLPIQDIKKKSHIFLAGSIDKNKKEKSN